MNELGMCCVLSLCVIGCAVCSYMYTYRQACLPLPVLAIFVGLSRFRVFVSFRGLFVWLQLRSFAFGGHARPSLAASASFCLVVVYFLFGGVSFSGLYYYFCGFCWSAVG